MGALVYRCSRNSGWIMFDAKCQPARALELLHADANRSIKCCSLRSHKENPSRCQEPSKTKVLSHLNDQWASLETRLHMICHSTTLLDCLLTNSCWRIDLNFLCDNVELKIVHESGGKWSRFDLIKHWRISCTPVSWVRPRQLAQTLRQIAQLPRQVR